MLIFLYRDKYRVFLFVYWILIEINYSVKLFVYELYRIVIDIYIY